jgi:hypothetical protein
MFTKGRQDCLTVEKNCSSSVSEENIYWIGVVRWLQFRNVCQLKKQVEMDSRGTGLKNTSHVAYNFINFKVTLNF